ncbi:MAG TPA: hypothetical protein VMB22_07775 [Verrucomicrobiae bacterium]|nr:hypothetical protein [Verrucomicrobiae bacterium]
MNLAELHKKLIAAARTQVLDGHVPYAFEKRVTALLASRVAPEKLDFWVRDLWRAAVSCVGIAVLCGVFTILSPAVTNNTDNDLSQTLDNTLLASINQSDQSQ